MVRKKRENINTHIEKLPFAGKYSMKNIPIPTKSQYMKKLIAQMEKVVKNMRWEALFFFKEDEKIRKLLKKLNVTARKRNMGLNL